MRSVRAKTRHYPDLAIIVRSGRFPFVSRNPSMVIGESGHYNLTVFLDCHDQDIPTYWGPHEVEVIR
jgi:hypothetical protein